MGSGPFRSGFVALLGRPNCGKSTLLNTILGEEVSPATPLPQTTRQRLRGVYTRENIQIVFVDTPGIHKGAHRLNESMLSEAKDAAAEEGIADERIPAPRRAAVRRYFQSIRPDQAPREP